MMVVSGRFVGNVGAMLVNCCPCCLTGSVGNTRIGNVVKIAVLNKL